jgi:hypothetical protein
MSDELRLPDHLAACEARLAAQMLPASGINRDELLYRAGWAAGAETARLAVVNPPPLKVEEGPRRRGARGGNTAAWSLISAAVAASIAVMVTLQLRPNESHAVVAIPADAHPQFAAETVEPRPSQLPRVEFAHATPKSLSSNRINTGLIALRQRVMTNAWAEPTNIASNTGEAAAPSPQTARDLMQELLPSESARRTSDWPWKRTSPGDSI